MGIKSCRFIPITSDDIIYFAFSDRFCVAAFFVSGRVYEDVNHDNPQGSYK
ncbi:MAG: hypothetical protein ABSG75_13760 [Syntrophales bacterium]|jgi:hypothetical protein